LWQKLYNQNQLTMKIKVCGLNQLENIKNVSALKVNYLGFIFYSKSNRCMALDNDLIESIRTLKTKKIGVFVNEELDEIIRLKELLNLDYIQLHGNESVEFCKALITFSKLIKVFKVDAGFDFKQCEKYQFVDYFLFETKGKLQGGNGMKFDWNILKNYHLNIPFFLSGGIGIDDINSIKKLKMEHLKVIDVNSGFEIKPGYKNIDLLKQLKNEF